MKSKEKSIIMREVNIHSYFFLLSLETILSAFLLDILVPFIP